MDSIIGKCQLNDNEMSYWSIVSVVVLLTSDQTPVRRWNRYSKYSHIPDTRQERVSEIGSDIQTPVSPCSRESRNIDGIKMTNWRINVWIKASLPLDKP